MPTFTHETQDRRGQQTFISVFFFYCKHDVLRDNSKGKHWVGKLSGFRYLYKRPWSPCGQFPRKETQTSLCVIPADSVPRLTGLTSHNVIADMCALIPTRNPHVTFRAVGSPSDGSTFDTNTGGELGLGAQRDEMPQLQGSTRAFWDSMCL